VQAELVKSPRRNRNARFEEQLAFEIRAQRLPEPVEQHRWATELVNANGRPRQFKADFAWPPYRLICEIQGGLWMPRGGGHSHPMHIEKDIERQQCAVLLGWWIFPVTTDEVKSGKAIGLVVRALAARGWTR
jgi:very-short-patch-repair endonuclease